MIELLKLIQVDDFNRDEMQIFEFDGLAFACVMK